MLQAQTGSSLKEMLAIDSRYAHSHVRYIPPTVAYTIRKAFKNALLHLNTYRRGRGLNTDELEDYIQTSSRITYRRGRGLNTDEVGD